MIKKVDRNKLRVKKHKRIRNKIVGTAERPRLSVYRSANNIFVQVIDDQAGVTLVSASTIEKINAIKTPKTNPKIKFNLFFIFLNVYIIYINCYRHIISCTSITISGE